MKKNKLIVMGVLSLVPVVTVAQDEWSLTTSFTYETAYMFRGQKLAENTYFPSVDLAYGGFYVGAWAALPVDSKTNNEFDLYAGYSFQLSEVASLDAGATYYTYPSITDGFFDDDFNTLEFYTGVSFAVPYSPALYVYYDIDAEVLTFEASAGHSVPMAEGWTFDISAAAGYVIPDDADEYVYGVATAGFGFQVNDAASISVYASYSIASEDYEFVRGGHLDIDDDEVWFGVSFTAGF